MKEAAILTLAAVVFLCQVHLGQGELLQYTIRFVPPEYSALEAVTQLDVWAYPNYMKIQPTYNLLGDVRRDAYIDKCNDNGCKTDKILLLNIGNQKDILEFMFLPGIPVFTTFKAYSSSRKEWLETTHIFFESPTMDNYPSPFSNCTATMADNAMTISWNHDDHSEFFVGFGFTLGIFDLSGVGQAVVHLDTYDLPSAKGPNSFTFNQKYFLPKYKYDFDTVGVTSSSLFNSSLPACEMHIKFLNTTKEPEQVKELLISKNEDSNSTFNLTWRLPEESKGWDGFIITCATEGGQAGVCDNQSVVVSFSDHSAAGQWYSYQFVNALQGVRYKFSIVTRNHKLTSEPTYSAWMALEFQPVTSVVLEVVAGSVSDIDLSWKLPEEGKGWYSFEVTCKTPVNVEEYCLSARQSVLPYQSGGNVTQTTRINGLIPGVTYQFDIVTVNGELKTSAAHSNYLTIKPLSPSNLKFSQDANLVTLTWEMDPTATFHTFLLEIISQCDGSIQNIPIYRKYLRYTVTLDWLSKYDISIWAIGNSTRSKEGDSVYVQIDEERHCSLPTGLQGRLVGSDGSSTNIFLHNKTYELVCDQGYISAGGPSLIKCHHGKLSHHPECVERRTVTCSIPEDLVGVLRDSNGRQLTSNPSKGTFNLECVNGAGKLKESKPVQCVDGKFSEQLTCPDSRTVGFGVMLAISIVIFLASIAFFAYTKRGGIGYRKVEGPQVGLELSPNRADDVDYLVEEEL